MMLRLRFAEAWRRCLAVSACLLALLVSQPARADGPSVERCLDASEASIQSDNLQHLLQERVELTICAAATCPAEVRAECGRRLEQVRAALPKVSFEVTNEANVPLTGVQLRVDGEPRRESLDAAPIELDPGSHTLVFEHAGSQPLSLRLTLALAEQRRQRIILPAVPRAAAARSRWSPERIAAVAIAGVAAVGLGVGGAFGGVALARKSHAQELCPRTTCDTQEGSQAWHRASTAATTSTVFLIVGGVGLAVATTLWFEPFGSGRVQVGVGAGSLELKGAFE